MAILNALNIHNTHVYTGCIYMIYIPRYDMCICVCTHIYAGCIYIPTYDMYIYVYTYIYTGVYT